MPRLRNINSEHRKLAGAPEFFLRSRDLLVLLRGDVVRNVPRET
jgi:hypothetical protein